MPLNLFAPVLTPDVFYPPVMGGAFWSDMEIKSFSANNDSEHGYSSFLDARLSTEFAQVEITISVTSGDGSPQNLARCVLGLAEDIAGVLVDAQQIDRRAEDF